MAEVEDEVDPLLSRVGVGYSSGWSCSAATRDLGASGEGVVLGHAHQDGFLADELDGQVGIVAGQGIGLATVTAFLGAGMNVVGGDLVVDHIDKLAASSDGRVVALDVDLATPDGPARLVDEAVERYGAVDVLVKNAAVIGGEVPFVKDFTDEQWQSSLTINLLAAVRASRAAVPVVTAAGRGVILTVGSDAGGSSPIRASPATRSTRPR